MFPNPTHEHNNCSNLYLVLRRGIFCTVRFVASSMPVEGGAWVGAEAASDTVISTGVSAMSTSVPVNYKKSLSNPCFTKLNIQKK